MFTGREYDAETGLYYYRARSYSPQIGRFLQTDPVSAYDENRYTYCYNNPVNLTDPYGLVAVEVSGVFPGAANSLATNSGGLEAGAKIKPASTDVTDQYLKNAKKVESDKNPLKKKGFWENLRDLRIKIAKHPPHHSFNGEKKAHIQITVWQKGQKGSQKNYYFPL